MQNRDSEQPAFTFGGEMRRLQLALNKLESASALISLLIKDELAGEKGRATLEGLFSAKGALTCAIEEAQKVLSTGP